MQNATRLTMAVTAAILASGCRSSTPEAQEVLSRLLREYVVAQEAHLADHGRYAGDVDSTFVTVPPGVSLTIVSSSATAHSAVARAEQATLLCAVWVGARPIELDHDREADPVCDAPTRYESWLAARENPRQAETPAEVSRVIEVREAPRPVGVDTSACAAALPGETSAGDERRSVRPRLQGGAAEFTVDRPLRRTLALRPRRAFRASSVALDGDTVWFTQPTICPTEAVAYLRSTGEWLSTVRHQCRELRVEPHAQLLGGPVPNPETGSPPRQIEETVYSDPAFQDSVPLVDDLWLELQVAPVADSSRSETVYRGRSRRDVTREAHYVLHTPGDTGAIALRVPDEQWRAAAARWDRTDLAELAPSTRVTHWLMVGNALFVGLSRDIVKRSMTFAVEFRLRRPGAILQVDLTTRRVMPVLHPALADWQPENMYIEGGTLWDVGRYASAGVYQGSIPTVTRVFRWSLEDGRCTALRAPDAVVVGDSVWLAYADRLTLIDYGNDTESTLYYRDSTFTLADGADTLVTVLSGSGPGMAPAPSWSLNNPPERDPEYGRWVAEGVGVRRKTAFIEAYLTLPDSARRSIRDFWEICALAEGGCEDPLPALLAHDALVPFLPDAWRHAQGRTAWYDGVLGAMQLVGGEYLEAVLRAALDSAPIDRAAASAELLLERGDSTGVAWMRRALRDPQRIADTSRLRESRLRALDYVVNLAARLRDVESMPAIIDLLGTPHWEFAPQAALVRLTGLQTAPQPTAGQSAVAGFWRQWWSEHAEGFVPVPSEVGREALRAWRQ